MIDREKVIKALECHQIQENWNAWNCVGCPYIWTDDCTEQVAKDVVELLKEQDEAINYLTDATRQLHKHIKDLSEYMTPYGRVADVKAYEELLKERKELGTELTNAVVLIRKKNERIEKLLIEQNEREKRICKEICDYIRGSCSTDTYEDKEYVCHVIQQMFIKGKSVSE